MGIVEKILLATDSFKLKRIFIKSVGRVLQNIHLQNIHLQKTSQLLERFQINAQIRMASQTVNAADCRQQTTKIMQILT